MADSDNIHIEVQKDTGSGTVISQPTYIPSRPYSKLPREFSEDDLKSSAGQRFLLSEIDRLEYKVSELESFEQKFHVIDKENAILNEKLKTNKFNDILYGLFLTIGSAIVGLAPFFWEKGSNYGVICLIIGAVMLISGIVIKFIRWK